MSFFSCSLQLFFFFMRAAISGFESSGRENLMFWPGFGFDGEPPFFAQPCKADLSAYDSELHLINIAPLDPARQPL